MSPSSSNSAANAIMQYSFLHAFANDGTIDADELAFMEKLALKDGIVDDDERRVLAGIFSRVSVDNLEPDVLAEMQHFCHQHQIKL